MEIDNFMKTRIFVGLCVALVASFISVRAVDNLDQAAARAALEQKMYELDHPQAQSPPPTSSAAGVTQPGESTTNATNTVTAKAVTSETTPATTTPVAAPKISAPTAEVPTTAAFVTVVPAQVTPTTETHAATASEMAAARAAMEQRMYVLDHSQTRPSLNANSTVAVTLETTPAATKPAGFPAPAAEAPVKVIPAVETPSVEAPATIAPTKVTPVAAPAAVAPVSPAPVAGASAPKVFTAPAKAPPVAAAPATTAQSVATTAKAQPTTAAAILGPTLALHAATLSSSSPGQKRSAIELATVNGSIYKNVEVDKVMPDGIVISYTLEGGGWAMTKVLFSDLSPEQRQRYEKQ